MLVSSSSLYVKGGTSVSGSNLTMLVTTTSDFKNTNIRKVVHRIDTRTWLPGSKTSLKITEKTEKYGKYGLEIEDDIFYEPACNFGCRVWSLRRRWTGEAWTRRRRPCSRWSCRTPARSRTGRAAAVQSEMNGRVTSVSKNHWRH